MAAEGGKGGEAKSSQRFGDDGETPTDMEEERENLRRQIIQLQNLISRHKHIHGDSPAPSAPGHQRWRNPSQPQYRPRGSFRGGAAMTGYQPRQPAPSSTWRAQYSLVNRTSRGAEHNVPPPPAWVSGGNAAHLPSMAQKVTVDSNTAEAIVRQRLVENAAPINNNYRNKSQPSLGTREPRSDEAVVASTSREWGVRLKESTPVSSGGTGTSLQVLQTSQDLSQGHTGNPPPPSHPSAIPFPKSALSSPLAKKRLAAPPPNPPKNTLPAVISPRALRSSKTKYTWVASSPKTNLTVRKVSPGAKKANGGPERVKSPIGGAVTKTKRSSPNQKCAPKNRYKWKAQPVAGASSSPVTTGQSSVSRSVLRVPQSAGSAGATRNAAPYRDSGYKVKSRTKLVRRRSTSRSPVEKKASPLPPLTVKSRYVLRRKSLPRVKSPVTVKRISPRGLVHLSKHRLRRLPPARPQSPALREGSPSSVKIPSASRVIKTRYRIVKRSSTPPLVSPPLTALSPSTYWRNRVLRQLSPARRTQPQLRWRKSLRCIEGTIYQVSANRLSKTWSPGTASKSPLKTWRTDVSSVSPGSLYSSRTATPTRYLASRAVQRSLAIIRQAQQKKAKKEYCMYYNRFGRCKRGDSCPFIHDPEKVAVCTMFLRGTCKQTDGTCPFSHKVSKEKMPVCSYFLKGNCRKTDCPYSHVYVSRKAEVCQDFLKGYCPMGAKCKKKHTLLCPRYARDGTCPEGPKCKLQHRQRKKRAEAPTPEQSGPSGRQRRRGKEDSGRDQPPDGGHDDSASSSLEGNSDDFGGSSSCPSFISLSSSPISESTPTSSKTKPTEDTGKPLQIKPRL